RGGGGRGAAAGSRPAPRGVVARGRRPAARVAGGRKGGGPSTTPGASSRVAADQANEAAVAADPRLLCRGRDRSAALRRRGAERRVRPRPPDRRLLRALAAPHPLAPPPAPRAHPPHSHPLTP